MRKTEPAAGKSILITFVLIVCGILIGGAIAFGAPKFRIWVAALNAPGAFQELQPFPPDS